MTDCAIDRTGWVPSRFTWVGGQGFVDWSWIGNHRFTAPFFDDTIQKAQAIPFNRLFAHCSPISELVRWSTASPGLEPSGFIFHMSRCGSTLVSQMLAALHNCVVISEAGPIDRLARAFAIPEQLRALWLRSMVSAFGQKRSGRETRYFIKFDSVTILAARFIRRIFPGVPWIFLYRDPEEVLVSHLRTPAPAMAPGIIGDIRLVETPIAEALAMPPEEHAARAIGRLCASACQVMDEPGMLLNYTELPEAVFSRLADHFALKLSADEIGTMRNTALFNAKRPRQKFEADGESKRLEVSDAVRVASNRWILPHYEELERFRLAARPTLES